MSGKELKEKVYFCGSIRAGRDDQPIYEALAKHLTENYGPVLTQHVAQKIQKCDISATEQEIHDFLSYPHNVCCYCDTIARHNSYSPFEISKGDINEWIKY